LAAGLAIAKSLRYGSVSQIQILMKPSAALQAHRIAIRGVVARHHALNARVFGSVLRGDDQEGSDLDILIDPTPQTSLMDVAAIQVELESLLGVKVDVLTPRALPEKFRGSVLAEAIPV
jgi:predicted nucleotidyltransferase